MKYLPLMLFVGTSLVVLGATLSADDGSVVLPVAGEDLVHYQAEPLAEPSGGEGFKGSNFVHPLKTPSGFVVSQSQPADHYHHFGLWWPWKYIEVEGRKILCWELQGGEGLVEAVDYERVDGGIVARSIYYDRKATGGRTALIEESSRITTSDIFEGPARGYFLDLEISEKTAGEKPVTVSSYRYSGFSIRATEFWDKENSTILTSEGEDRDSANFSRARWVLVQGDTAKGEKAGFLMMSDRENRSHPEKLRTWDTQENGAVFVNFNTVYDDAWEFAPGNEYVRKYRLFVFDGELNRAEAEMLWSEYALDKN